MLINMEKVSSLAAFSFKVSKRSYSTSSRHPRNLINQKNYTIDDENTGE